MANCDAESSLEQLSTNLVCMGINDDDYNIPEEIVEKILLLLPQKSLIRFKCVCRSLCTLIEDPSFTARHFRNTRNNICSSTSLFFSFTVESVIFDDDIYINCNPNYSPFYHYSTTAELPTLNIINTDDEEEDDDRLIHCTGEYVKLPITKDRRLVSLSSQCDGLLCLFDDNGDLFLCNPLTRELRTLPPCFLPPIARGYSATFTCGLGYDPKAKDYKIIRIDNTLNPRIELPRPELYSLSSNSWREIDLSNIIATDMKHGWLRIVAKVYLKGVYYFLANGPIKNFKIICFDMCEEEFYCISLPSCCRISYRSIAVWNECVVVFPVFHYEYSERDRIVVLEMWVMDGGNGSVREGNSCFWTKHCVIRFVPEVAKAVPFLFWKGDDELLVEVVIEGLEKRKLISYNIGTGKFRNLPFGTESSPNYDEGYNAKFRFGTDHNEYDTRIKVKNVVPYVKSLISVKEGKRLY